MTIRWNFLSAQSACRLGTALRTACAALVALAALAGGCAPPTEATSGLSLQVYRDGGPVASDAVIDPPELFDAAAPRVYLAGALNEVVAFRLELRVAGTVDVRVGDFISDTGRQLSGNVELYQVHHVRVQQWPGWYVRRFGPQERERFVADVLVPARAPRGGLPTQAVAGRPVKLWADVRIPKGTAPGVYSAPLTVLVDGTPAEELDLSLNVQPFVLPDDAGLEFIADLDQQSLFAHHVRQGGAPCAPERILADHPAAPELAGVLNSAMRLLRDHRLTPQLPRLYPVVRISGEGNLAVDWADYDRVVAPYLAGEAFVDRRPLELWPVPLDERFPEGVADGHTPSPLHARILGEYLAEAARHFTEQGWAGRGYVRIPYGQRMTPAAQAAARHYGYIIRRAAPRLDVLSTLFPQDARGYGWWNFPYEDLRDAVSIWAPSAQFFDKAAIAGDLGAKAWFSIAEPPFSGTLAVCASAPDTRVLGWQAWGADVRGVQLGVVNAWPEALDRPANPQDCVAADPAVLIYPGTLFGLNEPIPSVRLKRLRRSAQDAAYLTLLSAQGREHIARTLAGALAPTLGVESYGVNLADGGRGGWPKDPQLWDMARAIMADELVNGGVASASATPEQLPSTIRWRRFMELTRQVQAQVVGTRIHPAGAEIHEGVEVVCTVALSNRSQTPIEGKFSFADLPVGWAGAPGSRYVPRIEPGGSRVISLTAVTGSLAWNADGVLRLPLVYERDDGLPSTLSARLSHVTAAELPEPITVDGDLDEWPPGVGNDASSFALVTGATAGDSDAEPRHRTVCLVGQRGDRLYFGVRCELTSGGQPDLRRRPPDVPDDLVPVGAEAVEILLDPTNAGSPSTAEVYRISVGPGGALWQHGVATDPPTAPSTVWPANIRQAVRVANDHWSAEIEVPLAAFPEGVRDHKIWGLNIARFDIEYQEFSNWAGAVGNVYNPRSLGNLTLP